MKKLSVIISAVLLVSQIGGGAYGAGTRPDSWLNDLPVGIVTGKNLIGACQNREPREAASSSWCIGYLEAIRDSMYVDNKLLCSTPDNSITDWEHLRVLVLAYFYRHPEMLQEYAGIAVKGALNEAFPCR